MVVWTDGKRPGTKVLVVPLFPGAGLLLTLDELDDGAVAGAPVAAAGTIARLQHRHLVAELQQLIRGHQAGDAATRDHHADALADAGRSLDRSHFLRLHREHAKCLHRGEGCGITTGLSDAHEEVTTGNRHRRTAPSYCLPGAKLQNRRQGKRREHEYERAAAFAMLQG